MSVSGLVPNFQRTFNLTIFLSTSALMMIKIKSQCPDGCPCPEYTCSSTTTEVMTTTPSQEAKESILILNTSLKSNFPILTDITGRDERNLHFSYDEGTSVYESCSLVWNNQMYVLGGVYQYNDYQVSHVLLQPFMRPKCFNKNFYS